MEGKDYLIMNSNTTKLFTYLGNEVTFRSDDGTTFVNATEMAKPFGKRPVDWLENQNTTAFLSELSKVRKSTLADLVVVKKGGNAPGSWMHEDVALEFARWLSPAFAIWCNDRIKELVRHGFTATESKLNELISNPDLLIGLATELKKERAENQLKTQQLQIANDTVKDQAPKVEYYNKVLESKGLVTINVIAGDFGISARKMNEILKNLHVIYKTGEVWYLSSKYRKFGYAEHKPFPYIDSHGIEKSRNHLYWTEKGRKFIHEVISRNNGTAFKVKKS